MPRRRLILLVLLCGLSGPSSDAARTNAQPTSGVERIRLGMTASQVRDHLGVPTGVSRRIILYRTHEQWHYAKSGLRLSFDHPRGSPPVLIRIATRE
jgi:hypothetical protein